MLGPYDLDLVGTVVWDPCFKIRVIAWTSMASAMSVIQDTWSQYLFKICATSPVGVFPLYAKIISWAMWQEAVLALRCVVEQQSVCCSRRMAYTAEECVCVFREAAAAAEQGVVGDSHQGQCSASSEAGRCATACLGRPPPRQSHFPKVAVTHGAPSPAVYVTVPVKGIMAWHLTFLFWGRSGESCGVRVGLNLFLRMWNVLIAPLV